ncbi:MAG: hypothetical protein QW797_10175 [Thermoproteota archaeon]
MDRLEIHETLRDRAVFEVFPRPHQDRSSRIHIGSGGGELIKSMIRFPVNGRLVSIIPAESLKGVLRAEATKRCSALNLA